jgi:putative Mg2+ transporter-C (MgtC) family protein
MRDFNLITVLVRLVLSAFCGGIIGIERGKQRRAAGLRTHILVCVGAALTATIGYFSVMVLGISSDPMRIAAQVISGIGFLGVGTILVKGRFQITGLTTSAGLWVTAAIGLAFGAGFYEGALIAFALSAVTVVILHRLERKINAKRANYGVYVEIKGDENVRSCLNFLAEEFDARDVQVTIPRSGYSGNIGIEVSILFLGGTYIPLETVIEKTEAKEYVVFAIESL